MIKISAEYFNLTPDINQVRVSVKETYTDSMYMHLYLDGKQAARLRDELTAALQELDNREAERTAEAHKYMEEA